MPGYKKMMMERKKAAMGYSAMDEDIDNKMRKQMATGSKNRMTYGHGGKAKSDIYAMEDACNSMAGYNKSLTKGR